MSTDTRVSSGSTLVKVPTYLHPLDREEGGEISGESGQHEDDEEPVSCHQGATRKRLRGLATTLGSERSQGEPETLFQGELSVGKIKKIFSLIARKINI